MQSTKLVLNSGMCFRVVADGSSLEGEWAFLFTMFQ